MALIGALIEEDIMILLPSTDCGGYTLMGFATFLASGFALNDLVETNLGIFMPRFRDIGSAYSSAWRGALKGDSWARMLSERM